MTENIPRTQKRVDEFGRAFAGSQLQLQIYANSRVDEINQSISRVFDFDASTIDWVSPLEQDRYQEYRDSRFLDKLGLSRLFQDLKQFWPARGPRWDGLVRSRDRVILIEAKSYPAEVRGRGCMAKHDSRSYKLIEAALQKTAADLNVEFSPIWLGSLYQYANRLAHAAFLRRHGVDAYLINVCFADDLNPSRMTSVDEWKGAIVELKREMGLGTTPPPWLGDIILPSRVRSDLMSVNNAT